MLNQPLNVGFSISNSFTVDVSFSNRLVNAGKSLNTSCIFLPIVSDGRFKIFLAEGLMAARCWLISNAITPFVMLVIPE